MAKEIVKKPLCIVGTAASHVDAPWDDDTFEMWTVSGLLVNGPGHRIDRVFELHPWWELRSMLALITELEQLPMPIYMQEVSDEIPTSVKYPHDEIKRMFHLDCMGPSLYATNTITWMILLAIYEGYRDFSLFGVHMAHEMEYAYQRSSCSWALGIIHGYMLQGLPYTLHIADGSELLRAKYEYGFHQPTKLMMHATNRVQRYAAGVDQTNEQMEKLKQARWRTEGGKIEAEHWKDFLAGYK